MKFVWTDGGERAAGYAPSTGDCGWRAIAIATQRSYFEVTRELNAFINDFERKTGKAKSSRWTGLWPSTMRAYMKSIGWVWVPTMGIGKGCNVHLRADELPLGRIICRVSRHYTAVVDGVIHDIMEGVDREGKRCVYGYWYKGHTYEFKPNYRLLP